MGGRTRKPEASRSTHHDFLLADASDARDKAVLPPVELHLRAHTAVRRRLSAPEQRRPDSTALSRSMHGLSINSDQEATTRLHSTDTRKTVTPTTKTSLNHSHHADALQNLIRHFDAAVRDLEPIALVAGLTGEHHKQHRSNWTRTADSPSRHRGQHQPCQCTLTAREITKTLSGIITTSTAQRQTESTRMNVRSGRVFVHSVGTRKQHAHLRGPQTSPLQSSRTAAR
jgi:hypothetical protein